ncbi:MAG: hypothetical protein QOE73_976 [Verrucomicrobiota bacterium]
MRLPYSQMRAEYGRGTALRQTAARLTFSPSVNAARLRTARFVDVVERKQSGPAFLLARS